MNGSPENDVERVGPERTWVGIAANAHSGRGAGRARVERLVSELDQLRIESRVAWTPEERTALVEETRTRPGCRCLVAAGGDGTIGALLNERPRVPVTVLPAGTENLFARHFGIGRQPEDVARMIGAGQTTRIDLGTVGDRRFGLMAGIGFDADVVTRHHLTRVGRAGQMRPTHRAAYVEPVLRSSLLYRFPPLEVEVLDPGAEEQLAGSMAFVFNLPDYALGLPIAPTATEDDGLLDLVVFRDPGPFQALRYLWLVFRGIHLKKPGVEHRKVRSVRVGSTSPVPVQLDGDPGGVIEPGLPWTFAIEPGAIDVLVPESYRVPGANRTTARSG